eukprot:SAG11_NODE_3089_length_2702_cov_3.781022_3_plen_82_part_00
MILSGVDFTRTQSLTRVGALDLLVSHEEPLTSLAIPHRGMQHPLERRRTSQQRPPQRYSDGVIAGRACAHGGERRRGANGC